MTAPDLLSPEFDADPYSFYETIREDHRLLACPQLQAHAVSRYADVSAALKTDGITSRNYEWMAEPIHGRTILQMEGAEHSAYRRLINPIFRGQFLYEKLAPVMERRATQQVKSIATSGHVDLMSEFSNYYPVGVIVELLGLPEEDIPQWFEWYGVIVDFITNFTQDPEIIERGTKAKAEITTYLDPHIEARRSHPTDDLLSALCNAEIEGTRLRNEDVRAMSTLLLAAGGETTAKSIGLTLRNLMDRPDQMAAVRADRSLVDQAIVESLRWSSPVVMIMRYVERPTRLNDLELPGGHVLALLLGAANRDPRCFKNADEFDTFRSDLDFAKAFGAAANHLTFAAGSRHYCVGSVLSQVEINIALNAILDHMGNLRYAEGFRPQETGIWTRGLRSLEVEFEPLEPAAA
jgi:cytochrome P450